MNLASLGYSLANKATKLAENADIEKKIRDAAAAKGGLQGKLSENMSSMLPDMGTTASPEEQKTELEQNTEKMVKDSTKHLETNILNQTTFNINNSIAASLLSHVVKESDDDKYVAMLSAVNHVISIMNTIPDIQGGPNPMFGGNNNTSQQVTDQEVVFLLNSVELPIDTTTSDVKHIILDRTKILINKYLSRDTIKNHIKEKISNATKSGIIDIQLKTITDEITGHSFIPPPKTMLGGGTNMVGGSSNHYLITTAVDKLRETYFKIVTEATDDDKIKTILKFSISEVLKLPTDNKSKMAPVLEALLHYKDEVSKKAIEKMTLHEKIGHIHAFIEGSTELQQNMLECIKDKISNGKCLDGFFVRIGATTSACVNDAVKALIAKTQTQYTDATAQRFTVKYTDINPSGVPVNPEDDINNQPDEYKVPNKIEVDDQSSDDDKLKRKFQDYVSFVATKEPSDKVISSDIFNIIQTKITAIDDVDGGEELVSQYVDMILNIYDKLELLSNNGLFVLFNDQKVMDKINSVLMIFSDMVLNSDLPTCDNPAALTADIIPGNGGNGVEIKPPPPKPHLDEMVKLIMFLFKHHIQHFGEHSANVLSVPTKEGFEHDSAIYDGFDTELDAFIKTLDNANNQQKTMENFTRNLFLLYSNELKRKKFEYQMKLVEETETEYGKPKVPVPAPSYGGGKKTRKQRMKKHAKTRRFIPTHAK